MGQVNNVRKVVSALWREPGSIYEFFLDLSSMGYYSNTQLPAVSGISITKLTLQLSRAVGEALLKNYVKFPSALLEQLSSCS